MLRDSEIITMRRNSRYEIVTTAGIKHVASDLIRQGHTDLKPQVGTMLKLFYSFAKSHLIRRELLSCTKELLERFVNYELAWPRYSASVKAICEADRENYLWMQYDQNRVEALFARCIALLDDAEYRDLVKEHSSIQHDKNVRLRALTSELKDLRKITLRSIRSRGLFDGLIGLQKDEFYEKYEAEIQEKFLAAAYSGILGQLTSPAEAKPQ